MSNNYDKIIDALLLKADAGEDPVVQFTTSSNCFTVRNSIRGRYDKYIKEMQAMELAVSYRFITISFKGSEGNWTFTLTLRDLRFGQPESEFQFNILEGDDDAPND